MIGQKYKAYALYVGDHQWDDYTPNSENIFNDNPLWLDERHHYCCKVEAAVVKNGGTVTAIVPWQNAPVKSEDYISQNPTPRYEVWKDETKWIFDHWEWVKGDSTNNSWARPVFYNKWNIRTRKDNVYASISKYEGRNDIYMAKLLSKNSPDGHNRTTLIVKHKTLEDCNKLHFNDIGTHFYVYDGVDWNFDNYNYHTGKGATATFYFHCLHGCDVYSVDNPKAVTVYDIPVSWEEEDSTDANYRYVVFTAKCDGSISADSWDHEEKSEVRRILVHGPFKLDYYDWTEKNSGNKRIISANAVLKCTGEVNGHVCGSTYTIPAHIEGVGNQLCHWYTASIDEWRVAAYGINPAPGTETRFYEHDWDVHWAWNDEEPKATAICSCLLAGCTDHREITVDAAPLSDENCHTYKATLTIRGYRYDFTCSDTHPYVFDDNHSWNSDSIRWEWKLKNGAPTAKAVFGCKGCEATKEIDATVKPGTGGACHTYTATVTFNGKTYTDTKSYPEINHEWDVEKDHIHWEWNYNDGDPTAKATFDCMGCEAQKEIEAESVVKETGMAFNTYTATVTLDGETYTARKTFLPTVPGRPWERKDDGIISPPTPRFRDDGIITPIIPIVPIYPVLPK